MHRLSVRGGLGKKTVGKGSFGVCVGEIMEGRWGHTGLEGSVRCCVLEIDLGWAAAGAGAVGAAAETQAGHPGDPTGWGAAVAFMKVRHALREGQESGWLHAGRGGVSIC